VVLQRLAERNQSPDDGPRHLENAMVTDPASTPLLAQVTEKGHRIGAADETNFEYGLDCILDHASRLIEQGAAKTSPRQRKAKAKTGRITERP
jgi:hypothetical protein